MLCGFAVFALVVVSSTSAYHSRFVVVKKKPASYRPITIALSSPENRKPFTDQLQPFCHLQEAIVGIALFPAVGGVCAIFRPQLDAVGVGHVGSQRVGGHAGLGQVGPAAHAVQLFLLLRLVLVPAQE